MARTNCWGARTPLQNSNNPGKSRNGARAERKEKYPKLSGVPLE